MDDLDLWQCFDRHPNEIVRSHWASQKLRSQVYFRILPDLVRRAPDIMRIKPSVERLVACSLLEFKARKLEDKIEFPH
jgi:hypothetical protein